MTVQQYAATTHMPADRFDEQPYTMLTNRAEVDSKALSVVRNCERYGGYRGALTWHRIAAECKGNKGELRMEAMRDAAR